MSAPDSSRISVSEDKLRAILAEFKLDLFGELRKYATQASVEALTTTVGAVTGRVQTLEETRVTRQEYHDLRDMDAALKLRLEAAPSRDDFKDVRADVESLKSWRTGIKAQWVLLAFVITILATASWHIWG